MPVQDGRNIARRAIVIRRCVPSGERPEARIGRKNIRRWKRSPRSRSRSWSTTRLLWSCGRVQKLESCCSQNETRCSEGRFSDTSEFDLMFRDSQKQASVYFKRRPSMIIGTWMAISHCLKLGSVLHDSRWLTKKSTRRIYMGSGQTDKETCHNKTREHVARRMVKDVKRLMA